MFYNSYSYDIGKAYDNSEVQAFVRESREEAPDFYTGFDNLAKEMKYLRPSQRCLLRNRNPEPSPVIAVDLKRICAKSSLRSKAISLRFKRLKSPVSKRGKGSRRDMRNRSIADKQTDLSTAKCCEECRQQLLDVWERQQSALQPPWSLRNLMWLPGLPYFGFAQRAGLSVRKNGRMIVALLLG